MNSRSSNFTEVAQVLNIPSTAVSNVYIDYEKTDVFDTVVVFSLSKPEGSSVRHQRLEIS